ncbi:MAG: GDP-mannose 4,6-dehydratase [Candidatus Algichlamydia australiensis]|nr:GDP-mannose 4,6-dehydratase [Chlamydiales bacterium]
MAIKKKRVFITGIAGFIGMHTALALQARGDEVFGCDNFNSSYDPALKFARKEKLQEAGIAVFQKDIHDLESLNNCTHLVHLAAQPGVRYSVQHPEQVMSANMNGLIHILELLKNSGAELIFASSSSVYGQNEKVPFAESDVTIHPSSLYAATKMAGELICHSYHHLYKIPMRLLRFFTVYGPWGRPDMAYYLFADAIATNQPIQVFNHGKMERDFTYIDDIVQGILASIDANFAFEVFNLGNSHTETLSTFISLIEEKMGKRAEKNMLPMQKGDVTRTFADISKAEKLLGFSPKVPLDEGLDHFVNWFNAQTTLSRSS